MEATQFLVQWEEHPSHLATRLGYLLEHQSLVDVTLMCNTHTLKVHRAVLAACSPYFERQLGNHPLIVLKDMKFSVLKSLVEFMYCGETSISEENLTPLLEAAKFFEVKGLSSMTKESVCAPSTPLGTKTFNGTSVTATSGSLMGAAPRNAVGLGAMNNAGVGRGRGRGRGRPPLNTAAKVGSPTESAQILLSLSNTTTTDSVTPLSSSTLPSSSALHNQHHNMYKQSHSQPLNKTPSMLSGENKLGPSKFGPYEPRRRGRKRGAVNSAFRDRLLREQDTHMVLENLKRDLTDDNESSSPLLSSLLTGKPPSSVSVAPDKTPGSSGAPSDYVATKLLKEIGLPSNVPLLMDNGDGKLVTLTEEVLKSVGFDPESQIHVQGPSLSDVIYQKINSSTTTSKPLNHQLSIGRRVDSGMVDGCHPDLTKVKKEMTDNETNDEELIQKLRSGAACEVQNDPDAVVLYEVSGDKNVQKCVLSAKEVETLKILNAQLDTHKKELRDLQRQQESHMQQDDSGCVADGNGGEDKYDSLGSTTGGDSTSNRIAVLKMKISEVKAMLQQMMNIAQGIKPRNECIPKLEPFQTGTEPPDMLDVGDSVDLQINKSRIVYEFVDGDKIDNFHLRNPVSEKKENKDEFMGFFEMVCDNGETQGEEDVSPLLSESGRVVHGNSAEPSPRSGHHSSATFHVLEDDEVHDSNGETIPYEIDGMMNDEGHNIVIEGGGDAGVGGDVKDPEEDGTSSDFKYIMNVVYDSDHVIYDTAALPSGAQEEDTTEYIVYSEEDVSRHHVDDNSHHTDDGICKSDVIAGVQHSEMVSGVDFVELDDDRTDETNVIHRDNSPPVKKPRLQVDPL